MYRAAIITLSDKGFAGNRQDISGNVIKEILSKHNYEIVFYKILSDEMDIISEQLKNICDRNEADLILTTGGTGLSKRDVTPEATLKIAEKNVNGIAEAMRFYSLSITKKAMLSRGVCVIRKNTLIVNLPGSPKAVTESLSYIIDTLEHGIDILTGNANECGTI